MKNKVQYIDIYNVFISNKKHSISRNGTVKVTETVTYSESRKTAYSQTNNEIKYQNQNRIQKNNIYQHHGYKNRADYLYKIAIKYKLKTDDVLMLADLLGEMEDFDALPLHTEEIPTSRRSPQ